MQSISRITPIQLRDGNIFVSTHPNNSKSGLGASKEPDSSSYYGEFLNRKYHGKGSKTSQKQNSIYTGEFLNGKMHGYGELSEGKKIYKGLFANNSRNGMGEIIDDANGIFRKGNFKNGKMNGYGIISCPSRDYFYYGNFDNGDIDGVGKEEAEKTQYIGRFYKAERNGVGMFRESKKVFYLGNWKLGLRDGFGLENMSSGDTYLGDFERNEKTGIGKYTYESDKLIYTGNLQNGKKVGFGRLEADDYIYVGSWLQNARVGMGYQTNREGGSYFGEWRGDLREGIGVEVGNGYEYKGEWKDDQPHGRAIVTVQGKGVKAAIFKNGSMEKYIKMNEVRDIEETVSKMNFEQYFNRCKRKLVEFEEYLVAKKKQLENHFSRVNIDFDRKTKILEEKVEEISIAVDNLKSTLRVKYNQLKEKCRGMEFDLQEFLKAHPADIKVSKRKAAKNTDDYYTEQDPDFISKSIYDHQKDNFSIQDLRDRNKIKDANFHQRVNKAVEDKFKDLKNMEGISSKLDLKNIELMNFDAIKLPFEKELNLSNYQPDFEIEEDEFSKKLEENKKEKTKLEEERQRYKELKQRLEQDKQDIESQQDEMKKLALKIEEELDLKAQSENVKEDPELEFKKEELRKKIEDIDKKKEDLLKEKKELEKLKLKSELEFDKIKKIKVQNDRKRIYYRNFEAKLKKRRKKLEIDKKNYERERSIFDNKKIFLENEIDEMEEFKTNIGEREKKLDEDIEYFKKMKPKYLKVYEVQQKLEQDFKLSKNLLLDTEQELRVAKIRLQESETKVKDLEQKVTDLENTKKTEIEEIEKADKELQDKIEEQKKMMDDRQKESEDLKNGIEALKKEIEDKKKENEEKIKEYEEAEKEMREKNKDIAQLKTEIDDEVENQKTVEEALKKKKERIEENKRAKDALEGEIEDLEEKLNMAQGEIDRLDEPSIDLVKAEIEKLEKEMKDLEEEEKDIKVQSDRFTEDLEEFNKEKKSFDEKVEEFREEEKRIEKEADEYRQELEKYKKEKEEMDKNKKIILDEEKETQEEIEKIEAEIKEVEEKLKKQEDQNKKNEKLTEELDQLEKRVGEDTQELEKLKEELEEKKNKYNKDSSLLTNFENEEKELKEKMENVEEERKKKLEENKKLEEERKKFEEELAEKEKEMEAEKEKIKQEMEEEKTKHAKEREVIENKFKEEEDQLQKELDELKSENEKLLGEEAILDKELKEITEANFGDDPEIQELVKKEEDLKEEMELFEKTKAQEEEKLEEMAKQTESEKLKAEEQLKLKEEEIELKKKELKELEDKLREEMKNKEEENKKAEEEEAEDEQKKKEEEEKKAKEEEIRREKELEKEKEEDEEKLKMEKEEDEKWKEEKKELEDEIDDLKKKIEEEEAKMKDYEDELKELKEKRKKEEEKLKQERKEKEKLEAENLKNNKKNSSLTKGFFKNFKQPEKKLKLNCVNKMDISRDGKTMYIAGEACLYIVSLTGGEIEIVEKIKSVKANEVKVLNDNRIMVHNTSNNSLEIYSQSMKKLEEVKGYPVKGGDDRGRSCRFTGDDFNMLWVKGKTYLNVISTKDMKHKEIKDFWMFVSKRRKLTPLFAVASRKGDKIFGVGNDISASSILIYQEEGQDRVNILPSTYSNDIHSWLCAEISYNEDMIYVGGVHGNWGVVGAIAFDETLKSINFTKLTLGDFRVLTRLKRIEGSDILLAGCFGAILVMQFKANKFNIINVYANLGECEINSIVFYSSFIYYIESEGNHLGFIEFERCINQKEFHSREEMKALEEKSESKKNEDANKKKEEEEKDKDEGSMFDDPTTLSQRLTIVQVQSHKMPESSYIRFSIDQKKKRGFLTHKGGVEVYNLAGKQPVLVKTLSKIWAHSAFCKRQYIILQEYNTNNLEIYADDELIKTYKGEPADHSKYRVYMNVKSSGSSKKILWVSGKNSVSIINLKNLKESRFNDFMTYSEEYGDKVGELICLFRMQKPDIVMGLMVFKGKEFCMNCIYINEKYQEWLKFKQFFKEVSFVSAADISSTPNIFYMLAQHGPLDSSTTKLDAVKIENGQLTSISSVEINNKAFKQGYCLKVHQIVKERVDYIACGGQGQIVLSVFKANKITILRYFEDLHKTAIVDIGIIGNKIYTVGLDESKINHIYVPSELSKSSMLMNKTSNQDEGEDPAQKKKKIKFKEFEVEKIKILGNKNICKLDLDEKGETLYVGGIGVTILPTDTSSQEDSISRAKDLKVSWFKVFEDKILVQQSETYSLLVFDKNFSQIKKFKGIPGPCPDNESLRSCRSCNDNKISLWMMGGGSLGVVNPKDLSKSTIKNFFGDKDKSLPICAVSNKDGDKVMGLSAVGYDMKLCFYQKGKRTKLIGATEKMKEFGSFLSLEVDKKDNIVFIGGSTEYEFTEGEAILAAIQFSDKMNFISQIKLDDEDNKIVSAIRRVGKSNNLALGTSSNVYMLKFDKTNKFKKLCVVNNLHSGTEPICALAYHENNLYSCAPGDDYVQKITFTG